MRSFGKWLVRVLLFLVVLTGALRLLGPYEPVDADTDFDAALTAEGLEAYLAQSEARFDDITPGTEKRVIWAADPGVQTPLAVLYLHGFSATSEEIRPVPDDVARALGANLVFARLAGHGRGGAALAEPTAGDWIEDMAEATRDIAARWGGPVMLAPQTIPPGNDPYSHVIAGDILSRA